jgi:protein transport protein SEC24
LRCSSCYCFVNPFFTYSQNGSQFECNICLSSFAVPPEDYSPLGVDGRPIDQENRPYLTSSVYKFKVSSEYSPNSAIQTSNSETVVANYLFILDVSEEAIEIGIPRIALKKILPWIKSLTHRARIGFILLNQNINLVVKPETSSKPSILTLSRQPWSCQPLPVPASQVMLDLSDYTPDYEAQLAKLAWGIEVGFSISPTLFEITWAIQLSIT